MSTIPIFNAVRIIPRDEEFLNRKLGSRGEIFYDRDSDSLRLYNGQIAGGISLAKADLTNIDLEDFRKKSVESKLATVIYNVTVTSPQSPDTGNKYNLNAVYRLEPDFVVGYTYVFVQDHPSNVYFPNTNNTTPNPHPLNFSADNLSGQLGGGTSYLIDVRYFLNGNLVTQAVYNSSVFNTATSRQVQITVTNSTPATLYYWCWNHPVMGNEISVADPGSGTGGVADIEAGTGIGVALNGDTTVISNTGVLSILAGTGALVTDEQGVYTVSVSVATGNLTFGENTVDLSTGSEIVFVPDVTLQSDLVFSDGSRQNTATPPGADGVGISIAVIADDDLIITLTDSTVLNLGSVVGPEGPAGASGSGAGDVVTVGAPVTTRAIVRYSGTSGNNIQESLASVSDIGTIIAPAFSGNGSLVTALNATNLASGTVPDARFPATLPVASGVNLTALNATNLSSGTVPVARLGSAGTRDATTFLRGDNTWAVVVTEGGETSDSFATIAVAGQSNVVADSATDTLTLIAGTGVAITTDASTDTVTITNSSPNVSQNVFSTVAVTGQTNVVADTATDTLTIAAGTGISITTNAETDTITITSTAAAGVTAFTGLSDRADLTVDRFYLPAITMLSVTNNGASAYRFDQYGTEDNPTVYAINGTTIAFNLNVSGHPFLIQNGAGVNYNTGLVHVSTSGTVTTGTSAQGQTSGTLYWKIPTAISGGYRYVCSIHNIAMVGSLFIKTFSTI